MTQQQNISQFYDEIANVYEKEYLKKADYQAFSLLQQTYKEFGITSGSVLDIGSGTGILQSYLGDRFTYQGIELSPKMAALANSRGYKTMVGPVEELVTSLENKTFDHIVALGSLLFVTDLKSLVKEIERVAKCSYFLTLEQSSDSSYAKMKSQGMTLYNHSSNYIENTTKLLQDVYLWQSPTTGEKVYGDIVFKLLRDAT